MITIYHNPRCRKSRETLQLLEAKTKNVTIVKYLDNVPSEAELETILKKLDIKPIELVRKTEPIWKEHYKNKTLSDKEIIKAMVTHPKLIERPIVISNDKAVIGRPPENVLELL